MLETDAELVLVGPRGWNEALDAHLGDLPATVRDRVRLLGWVPQADLEALYAAAAVMCFPSLLEGFGFPVVEAMAQGTPVVTSRGTSTEELASGRRRAARRPAAAGGDRRSDATHPGRPGARARLGAAGLERAAEYTWERTAGLVAAAYAEVTAAQRRL